MICRAKGCGNVAIPMDTYNPRGLCGRHHEMDEEYPVITKPGPSQLSLDAVAKRNATRKANREARAS